MIYRRSYGDKPNAEKFFNDLLRRLQTGEIKFMYEEQRYYTLPKVTAEDKELKEYQQYGKKISEAENNLRSGRRDFYIDGGTAQRSSAG